jgi:hypothetical protein
MHACLSSLHRSLAIPRGSYLSLFHVAVSYDAWGRRKDRVEMVIESLPLSSLRPPPSPPSPPPPVSPPRYTIRVLAAAPSSPNAVAPLSSPLLPSSASCLSSPSRLRLSHLPSAACLHPLLSLCRLLLSLPDLSSPSLLRSCRFLPRGLRSPHRLRPRLCLVSPRSFLRSSFPSCPRPLPCPSSVRRLCGCCCQHCCCRRLCCCPCPCLSFSCRCLHDPRSRSLLPLAVLPQCGQR